MKSITRVLHVYALLLIPVGLASVLFNSQTSSLGWNPAGKTGLIVCAIVALLSVLFAAMAKKGASWAGWAAMALTFLVLSFCGRTVFKLVRDVPAAANTMIAAKNEVGETLSHDAAIAAIKFRMALFGTLGLISLSTFMRLWLARSNEKPAT